MMRRSATARMSFSSNGSIRFCARLIRLIQASDFIDINIPLSLGFLDCGGHSLAPRSRKGQRKLSTKAQHQSFFNLCELCGPLCLCADRALKFKGNERQVRGAKTQKSAKFAKN